MTFAVTAYKSSPCVGGGCTRRAVQRIEFDVTAANTDTDCDFGDLAAGAFWTDAEADVTHGAKATALKALLTALIAIDSDIQFKCLQLDANYQKVMGAPALAQEFGISLNGTSGIPEIVFVSGSAPTAATYVLEFSILEAQKPILPASAGTI